jgi:hypothetical protein
MSKKRKATFVISSSMSKKPHGKATLDIESLKDKLVFFKLGQHFLKNLNYYKYLLC